MNLYEKMTNMNFDRVKAMFEMKDISPKTHLHLQKVYGNLMMCTGICVLGMYLNAYTILSGFVSTIISILLLLSHFYSTGTNC